MPSLKRPLIFILLMMAGASLPAQQATLNELFMRGNIAYGNGEYAASEEAYRDILETARSAEVHYNLGNALAQQDKWSEAAFHYLKAYSLDPALDASRANLLLAADKMGLDEPYPSMASPANLLPETYWSVLAAIGLWGALIAFFHRDFVRFQLPLRRTLSVLFSLVLLVSATAILQHRLFGEWSVISSPEASLRVAPTSQSPGESILKEGDPIRILDAQQGFYHVMTRSGDEGFILKNEAY